MQRDADLTTWVVRATVGTLLTAAVVAGVTQYLDGRRTVAVRANVRTAYATVEAYADAHDGTWPATKTDLVTWVTSQDTSDLASAADLADIGYVVAGGVPCVDAELRPLIGRDGVRIQGGVMSSGACADA